MKDLISIKELSRKEIEELLKRAMELKQKPAGPILQGYVMASCFFEPSTRTRLCFEAAMKRLGGEVIGFFDEKSTSMQKGETLFDSMKVIGLYSDILLIRHFLEGAARQAAEATEKPVINAGDGANEHPSQTLLDLFTIQQCHGKIDDLHIACVGDLLFGRAVHSLVYALKAFKVRLYFVSSPALALPDAMCEELKRAAVPYSFHQSIEEVIEKVDILYMTRVQKERFTYPVKQRFVLTQEILQEAKKGLKILHPLPRVDELPLAVDQTEQAFYFQQAENGLYVRQALLCKLLGR